MVIKTFIGDYRQQWNSESKEMMYSLVDVIHGMHDISNSTLCIKNDGVNRNVPIQFEIMMFLDVRTPGKQSMVTIANKKLARLETLEAWSCTENCVEVVVGHIHNGPHVSLS